MSNPTLASAAGSSGLTIRKPALVLIAPNATDSRPNHLNPMAFILNRLGASFMTWQQVAVIAILVLGGCFLGFEGKETLAAMVLGAAGGFISQPLLQPRNNNPSQVKPEV